MEQKKAKIELYVNEEGRAVSIIEGNGMDLLTLMMAAIDRDADFYTLVLKAIYFLLEMKKNN